MPVDRLAGYCQFTRYLVGLGDDEFTALFPDNLERFCVFAIEIACDNEPAIGRKFLQSAVVYFFPSALAVPQILVTHKNDIKRAGAPEAGWRRLAGTQTPYSDRR